jgi:hypothetical protein
MTRSSSNAIARTFTSRTHHPRPFDRTSRFAVAAAAFVFAACAHASSLESSALAACTEAAAHDGHATHLDVVRVVQHAGRGSYEYWINADAAPARKAYCRTRSGEVTEFRGFDGRWGSPSAARPTPAVQTVSATESAAELCRSVDFTPPSNTGASLRND